MTDSLDDLAMEIRRCKQCPLHQTRRQAVPGVGPVTADVFLLGEAPGEEEDRKGRPFIGNTGKLMGRLVQNAGIDRRRLFISNTVRCRPPNNRDPLPDEMATCRQWTEKQLGIIKPKMIVTLGRFASAEYFPNLAMAEVRGCLTRSEGQLIFGSYHPAAALHQPTLRKRITEDFELIGEVIRRL